MALAHSQLPPTPRETIACDYFIDSLNDADFALKVREVNPTSLAETLRIVLQLAAWIRYTNCQKSDDGCMGKARVKEACSAAITEKNKPDDITAILLTLWVNKLVVCARVLKLNCRQIVDLILLTELCSRVIQIQVQVLGQSRGRVTIAGTHLV